MIKILKVAVMFSFVVAFLSVSLLLLTHFRLTNVLLEKTILEQEFLAQKMQELKELHDVEIKGCHKQVKLAVSGFRTGRYDAYLRIIAEYERNHRIRGED